MLEFVESAFNHYLIGKKFSHEFLDGTSLVFEYLNSVSLKYVSFFTKPVKNHLAGMKINF